MLRVQYGGACVSLQPVCGERIGHRAVHLALDGLGETHAELESMAGVEAGGEAWMGRWMLRRCSYVQVT